MVTEQDRGKFNKPSDDLNIELAIESVQGNLGFNPDLTGNPRHLELYRAVHPLGGNQTVEDAAKTLGVNKVTAYRWLDRVRADNPESDLHLWPTKKQTDVYRMIHPDLGGLTYREAASALKCSYQHVVDMMARMRKTHPQAFAFERIRRPEIVRYDPSVHDDIAVEKF
jgi:transposase